MADFLSRLLNFTIDLFAVSSMLSVGLSYTVRQIVDPLRNVLGVVLALVANFAMVPLLAYAVAKLLSLDRSLELGLILVAFAAGAPIVLKLAEIAGGNTAFTSGLLVLLLLVTLIYLPFVVPLAEPNVTVSVGAIARPLVLTMLLPLDIGLVLRARSPDWSGRLQPSVAKIANIALITLLVLMIVVHLPAILDVFGTGAIFAALLVLAGAFGTGYLFGAFGEDLRDEMALTTAQRNFAAALVVAESLRDPRALVMVAVTSVLSMALFFPVAMALGKHAAAHPKRTRSGREPQPGRRAPS